MSKVRDGGKRLRVVWYSMRSRCYNPNASNYENYGGRGIGICEEWLNSFELFEEWAMASGYDPDAPRGQCTIDRIDNDGDYEPSNCRWVPLSKQMSNKRKPRARGDRGGFHVSKHKGTDETTLCRLIREYRFTHDMSQREFAHTIGASADSVELWERGKLPSLRMAIKISDVLGVSLDKLAGRSTE